MIMRVKEPGVMNYGAEYMYEALMKYLRENHSEIAEEWRLKVRDAVDFMEPKELE
tara:strand:- start:1310 stop:1474 length:165 start_codon:yes stop_codon:yes gene_type:complete